MKHAVLAPRAESQPLLESHNQVSVARTAVVRLLVQKSEPCPGVRIPRSPTSAFINPRIGHIRLGKLTALQVQRLVGDVADAAGPAPAAKCKIILHGAFKQAIRWSIVSRNPVEAVEPPVQAKREMKVWSSQQAEAFLRAAKSHRLYAFFYTRHRDRHAAW